MRARQLQVGSGSPARTSPCAKGLPHAVNRRDCDLGIAARGYDSFRYTLWGIPESGGCLDTSALDRFLAIMSDSLRFEVFVAAPSGGRAEEISEMLDTPEQVVASHLAALSHLELLAASGTPRRYQMNRATLEEALAAAEALDKPIISPAPDLQLGSLAPDFELPAADGRMIRLRDFIHGRYAVVWFSNGVACPFCGRYRAELRAAHDAFVQARAAVLEVTPSQLRLAQLYNERIPFAFPYLCDTEGGVSWTYGSVRDTETDGAYAVKYATGWLRDLLGERTAIRQAFSARPLTIEVLTQAPEGFGKANRLSPLYLLDRERRIRYRKTGEATIHPAPGELLAILSEMRSAATAGR